MSRRGIDKLHMYDQETVDFDLFNSIDSEMLEIVSPPIKVYSFNIQKSLEGKTSNIDELYGEYDVIDEARLKQVYEAGFGGTFDPTLFRKGEIFDRYVELPGYYVEPTWVNELQRLGIETMEEDLTITFNYNDMMAKFGKQVKIGDVIVTFRGKIYRVMDAFIADETIGWKYIHFRIICQKPKNIDVLLLPN